MHTQSNCNWLSPAPASARGRATSPLWGLLLVGAIIAGPAFAACEDCNKPGNKFTVGTSAFFERVVSAVLPRPSLGRTDTVPTAPMIYEVTVGKDGVPCDVQRIAVANEGLAVQFERAFVKWRFNPPHIIENGRACCLASRIFIYVRSGKDGVRYVIPGYSGASDN
jgi:hypothetical protein